MRWVAYAAVVAVGLGLLVWLVIGTRYYYFDNARGVVYRDDGWTGIREVLLCTDEHRGQQIVHTCRWVKGYRSSRRAQVAGETAAGEQGGTMRRAIGTFAPFVVES